MSKILSIVSKPGQMGNTLLVSAHVLAFAIEQNYWVVNIPFDEYARYFNGTHSNLLCSYPKTFSSIISEDLMSKLMIRGKISVISQEVSSLSKTLPQVFKAYKNNIAKLRIDWSEEVILDRDDFLESIKEKKLISLDGWRFRAYSSVQKHTAKIRQYYQLLPEYQKEIDSLISKARSKGDILIGLHVRQGDYKQWMSGRFFYETSQYLALMKNVKSLFADQEVSFLICSNVDQSGYFQSQSNITFGLGSPVQDLYSLAQCDYILGPPSTFSLWASFYGEKPLYHIYDINQSFSLNNFSISDDLNWKL